MRIITINRMRTTYTGTGAVHESIFRSFHILEKVKILLERGTPTKVVLELIDEMEEKGRRCERCDGEGIVPDEKGHGIVCPGPCRGSGFTDLPLPEKSR